MPVTNGFDTVLRCDLKSSGLNSYGWVFLILETLNEFPLYLSLKILHYSFCIFFTCFPQGDCFFFSFSLHSENPTYHFTLVRMASTKKISKSKRWQWCSGKEPLYVHCQWEWKLVDPLWKAIQRFLKILTIHFQFDPAVPLFGIYAKQMQLAYQKDTNISMAILSVSISIVKIWNQSKVYQWISR